MQLVGATHWFIRIPFLLEGCFYGVAGGLGACLVLSAGYLYGISFLHSEFGQHHLPALVSDAGTITRFLSGVLFLGCAFGLAGSYLTTRRFLR
jgi:cell division transport system permease protein